MTHDERRGGQPERVRRRPPAGPLLFVLALLAARALSPHGSSADPGVTLTITNYRIGASEDCGLAETARKAPGDDPTPEGER